MFEAVHQPKGVAGVLKKGTQIIEGNEVADQAANEAAFPIGGLHTRPSTAAMAQIYRKGQSLCKQKEFSLDDSRWYLLDEILAIPQNLQGKLKPFRTPFI